MMKVLMLSKVFLKGHPREGEETGFREKFLSGVKRHTLRRNKNGYYRDGDFVSVRQWEARPYASGHEIVKNGVKIGVEPCIINRSCGRILFPNSGSNIVKEMLIEPVAANDGLSEEDFISWMFPVGNLFNQRFMNFIYLSDLRY